MADYKSMYLHLFNKVSDVISELQNTQAIMEEMYASAEDMPIRSDGQTTKAQPKDETTDE